MNRPCTVAHTRTHTFKSMDAYAGRDTPIVLLHILIKDRSMTLSNVVLDFHLDVGQRSTRV